GGSGPDAIDAGANGGSVDGGTGQDFMDVALGGRDWNVTDTSLQRTSPDPILFTMASIEEIRTRTESSTDAADLIDGSAYRGRLYLTTYDGNDRILGGSGEDAMSAMGGTDRLFGTYGDDVLRGGAGRDLLRGGHGDDLLNGGPGFDRCNGGRGRDAYRGCEVISRPPVS
ncbi:MAG TPA: hypothetical protein VE032_03855, partial [Actinomycetota bacterium]|nr:hypothetical protein [Actinomycetota bacterium]